MSRRLLSCADPTNRSPGSNHPVLARAPIAQKKKQTVALGPSEEPTRMSLPFERFRAEVRAALAERSCACTPSTPAAYTGLHTHLDSILDWQQYSVAAHVQEPKRCAYVHTRRESSPAPTSEVELALSHNTISLSVILRKDNGRLNEYTVVCVSGLVSSTRGLLLGVGFQTSDSEVCAGAFAMDVCADLAT